MQKFWRASLVAASIGIAFAAHAGAVRSDENSVLRPTGKGTAELDDSAGAAERDAAAAARVRGHGIVYHGARCSTTPTASTSTTSGTAAGPATAPSAS